MAYLIRCPNCGAASPHIPQDVDIEVWCPSCCMYDYEERAVVWRYHFVVKAFGSRRRSRLPGEDTSWTYGGEYMPWREQT